MGRRRFIYDQETRELVEVSLDYEPTRDAVSRVVNDRHYDGLRATDGTPIDTRAKHREYMRRNGLTTIDDFTKTWERAAQERADYFKAGKGGAVTREDVARAIFKLETGRDPER